MGAKDEILCPNFESRLEKQNYALNFRKTQLSNITVETNFNESLVRDVHLITGCLVSSDTNLVLGFDLFFSS